MLITSHIILWQIKDDKAEKVILSEDISKETHLEFLGEIIILICYFVGQDHENFPCLMSSVLVSLFLNFIQHLHE